jgi:flagella basal body P-ring formation protein FlgA
LALAHRTPQNSVSQINDQPYYAARALVPGRTLVATDLEVGRPVVVLTEALPARSLVTAASLVIEERAVDVPHDAVESLQGLGLLATNRLLHPGDILRKRDLTKAKLIKRGQRVAVESVGQHFRIASDLIALQDGYLGDQIQFQNIGSDRRVFATVTGAGKARSSAKR